MSMDIVHFGVYGSEVFLQNEGLGTEVIITSSFIVVKTWRLTFTTICHAGQRL